MIHGFFMQLMKLPCLHYTIKFYVLCKENFVSLNTKYKLCSIQEENLYKTHHLHY